MTNSDDTAAKKVTFFMQTLAGFKKFSAVKFDLDWPTKTHLTKQDSIC